MATFEAPDYVIGNSATIQAQLAGVLTTLDQALQALEPAPNATTVQFNDQVLVTATVGESAALTPSGLAFTTATSSSTIQNVGGYDLTVQSSNQLVLTSNDNTNINAGVNFNVTAAAGFIELTTSGGDQDILLQNTANDSSIRLYAPNLNQYQSAVPICLTTTIIGSNFTYNAGGQTMENVYNVNFPVPYEFFGLNPSAGYTSTNWKIEFALNCYQFPVPGDKGIGLYIEFQDQAFSTYAPITFNSSTPYSADQKIFGYASGNGPYLPVVWTDWVNFSGMVNTGSGNVPLNMLLWFAADNGGGWTTQFNLTITLTKTNLF